MGPLKWKQTGWLNPLERLVILLDVRYPQLHKSHRWLSVKHVFRTVRLRLWQPFHLMCY